MLYSGTGIPMDYKKALIYYKKGADLGGIKSMYMLGQMLLYGYGITKDRKGAQACFYNAANGGHVESQFLFGKMCIEDGKPVLGNVWSSI